MASWGLDTRTKIVELQAALTSSGNSRTAVVTGYFDPLLAAHALRLSEIRRDFDSLIVVLADPASPILTAQARAELVAALEAVDSVVLPHHTPIQTDLPGITVFDERPSHAALSQWLVDHVHRQAVTQ